MRDAFRRDLQGTGADPSKCGPHSMRSGGATMSAYTEWCQRQSVSATRSLEVAGSRCKLQTYMLMTIWIEDFLFPNSLGLKPCKQLVSIYLAFAQYFVTLYRGGSRQAVPK